MRLFSFWDLGLDPAKPIIEKHGSRGEDLVSKS
jgi:hypothetical protein